MSFQRPPFSAVALFILFIKSQSSYGTLREVGTGVDIFEILAAATLFVIALLAVVLVQIILLLRAIHRAIRQVGGEVRGIVRVFRTFLSFRKKRD